MKRDFYTDLKQLKEKFLPEGFEIVGLFGSCARKDSDIFSDIDLAYKINHEAFYKDNAYKKLLRIDEIKAEIEKRFHKKIDIVPLSESLLKQTKDEFITI